MRSSEPIPFSRRASSRCLAFLCKSSPSTLTPRIRRTCLRSAVGQQTSSTQSLNTSWCSEGGFICAFYISRSNNGLQGLHLRHRCRVGQVDATHGGQEVQVDGATHESLPLRPLLPGKGQSDPVRVDILTNGLINKCDNTPWFCHSCLVMSTGKGRSWKSTCFKPPYGSGRGHPYSTWVSPGAFLWSTPSTHRDRWFKKNLPSASYEGVVHVCIILVQFLKVPHETHLYFSPAAPPCLFLNSIHL